MRTDELDFHLPPELIAQTPAERRERSRLLHFRRDDRSIAHRVFEDLPLLIRRDDLLVFNDARVVPARFALRKHTGGLVEGLFVSQHAPRRWNVMLRNAPAAGDQPPMRFVDAPDVTAQIVERGDGGMYAIEVPVDEPATAFLSRVGRMPLPPYIRRDKQHDERDVLDRDRYQTVYAAADGSIAAPTAGLHFTPDVLAALDARGIERATVTLDVGLGTFKPVTADRLEDHVMHVEAYRIPPAAADALNRAKRAGRRIVAVGTTSARVLESQPENAPFTARSDTTGILIHPPYRWKHVGALITNFHLPRSTLVALVAALVGPDEQRRLYAEAIAQRYRFYSYGDAMLVE
jgi:S-adenosylmethionine:tRNA ribosyltransferase-isomerase